MDFAIGTVGHTLMCMRGTWHDQVELFELDGSPLKDDTAAGSGTPGESPFDNLVYLDFDGENLTLTNVHFRGRPTTAKTFTGKLVDGVLVFDPLGPGAYKNIGVSGGPGILTFNSERLEPATEVYMEPDFIIQTAPNQRVRHTLLYRNGVATRTLTAKGTRLSPMCNVRHSLDPRGPEGPVHETPFTANIWAHLVE
ncbi:hypothetical protein [Paraferrimonas sedimenticola]|uniref:Uncharacterized protein n=1 Tax=Paraferrimonas sedimenticola TaxID=375674 RepID=A0AA37RW31_9GAMM|nr:hypothetical protein [Paraferrimonas sedimenticola]GLP96405.1 hypothetical protein GCM10007895_17110 [Paraferrimonas sedimenticola]